MNRRKFLKKSSTGVVAAALLPMLSFRDRSIFLQDLYESSELFNANGKTWLFEFLINSKLYQSFNESTAEDRELLLKGFDEDIWIKLIYKAESLIQKIIDDKNLNFISYKIDKDQMTVEDYKFAKDNLGKEITVEIHDKCHAIVRNEKENRELKFRFSKTEDEPTCFLTTACVIHKKLPDDCRELTLLRALRENVMIPDARYNSLISEYAIIAPKMLININNASNKDEVLDYIYKHLVQPSICYIESGENEAAIEHYTHFVQAMKAHYL